MTSPASPRPLPGTLGRVVLVVRSMSASGAQAGTSGQGMSQALWGGVCPALSDTITVPSATAATSSGTPSASTSPTRGRPRASA